MFSVPIKYLCSTEYAPFVTIDLCSFCRFNRVMVRKKEARIHLKFLVRKFLNKKLKPAEEKMTPAVQEKRTRKLMKHLQKKMPAVASFVTIFLNKDNNFPSEVLTPVVRLLYLLSSDQPVSSVIPFRCHSIVRGVCQEMSNNPGGGGSVLIRDLKDYSKELAELFLLAPRYGLLDTLVNFAEYLVTSVEELHEEDQPIPEPQPIPGSYDPSKGVAYYFTEGGHQLRTLPKYNIKGSKKGSKGSTSTNYDDPPEADEECRKLFPAVSYGGYGYLFLWSCPLHGHAYGFHLIQGSEGRKDAFCSLYKYMETAPREIYYDFACQLSEYSLNRAPAFFKFTRFWHDLFHAITHLCGNNYKSGRVNSLDGINSEICEQTNSYLQCIKFTCSHLSQNHMVLFFQFFLFLMNKEKTNKFQKQAAIAYAGTL